MKCQHKKKPISNYLKHYLQGVCISGAPVIWSSEPTEWTPNPGQWQGTWATPVERGRECGSAQFQLLHGADGTRTEFADERALVRLPCRLGVTSRVKAAFVS